MDTFSPAERSRIMRSVSSRDTSPERKVRRLLHSLGFRYRLHRKDLPGTPDLVFPSRRKVIFVHGCFWHQHSCPAADRPTSRTDYWNRKLDRNMVRDRANRAALRRLGWKVFTLWECELKKPGPVLSRLLRFLAGPDS